MSNIRGILISQEDRLEAIFEITVSEHFQIEETQQARLTPIGYDRKETLDKCLPNPQNCEK